MKPAQLLILASAALLLVGAKSDDIEAADDDMVGQLAGGLSLDALAGRAEEAINVLTEEAADVDMTTAQQNIAAFLQVLQQAEGTAGRGGYRACYGYAHQIQSFADHPCITREWLGEVLADAMCANAGFGPGCKSTAAGAYQIIKPTWQGLKGALGLPDFTPASQDAAAVQLIKQCGALEDVKAGRFNEAVRKCRSKWASLPGNYAKQGQKTYAQLGLWFQQAGGKLA
jgi:lysozyme